jgi:hypothetical protein
VTLAAPAAAKSLGGHHRLPVSPTQADLRLAADHILSCVRWVGEYRKNTVATLMREQGLVARRKHRRRGTTKPDKSAYKPHRLRRTSPRRSRTSQGGPAQKPTILPAAAPASR